MGFAIIGETPTPVMASTGVADTGMACMVIADIGMAYVAMASQSGGIAVIGDAPAGGYVSELPPSPSPPAAPPPCSGVCTRTRASNVTSSVYLDGSIEFHRMFHRMLHRMFHRTHCPMLTRAHAIERDNDTCILLSLARDLATGFLCCA